MKYKYNAQQTRQSTLWHALCRYPIGILERLSLAHSPGESSAGQYIICVLYYIIIVYMCTVCIWEGDIRDTRTPKRHTTQPYTTQTHTQKPHTVDKHTEPAPKCQREMCVTQSVGRVVVRFDRTENVCRIRVHLLYRFHFLKSIFINGTVRIMHQFIRFHQRGENGQNEQNERA